MSVNRAEELSAEEAIRAAEKNAEAAAEAAAQAAGDAAKKEGLSEEDVNKRIEAARKQEKDKLYGEIQSLKTLVKQLTDKASAEEAAKKAAADEAARVAEEQRQAKLTADERLREQMTAFEHRMAEETKRREELEQALQRKEREAELAELRAKAVREAGDDVIPELIRGNSPEEIHQSIAYAKSRYQELFAASTARAEGTRANNVRSNMPGVTGGNSEELDAAELQASIANINIDMKRYAKDQTYKAEMDQKRDAALERVSMAYRNSMGR